MKNYAAFACSSAALLGTLGVIAGAMGAHALEKILDADSLDSYETAVRFQMYHAILLLGIGILAHLFEHKLLNWAIWAILIWNFVLFWFYLFDRFASIASVLNNSIRRNDTDYWMGAFSYLGDSFS